MKYHKTKLAILGLVLVPSGLLLYTCGPGGSGVLARYSEAARGEVLVTQEWRGWFDPGGHGVTLWCRPNDEELWGYDVLQPEGFRWRGVSLVPNLETRTVQVYRGQELVADVHIGTRTTVVYQDGDPNPVPTDFWFKADYQPEVG